jgi:hypothetical protein
MASEPAYKVEEWTKGDHVLRVIAGADNLFIARAAYREAVARYPDSIITLRQACRVLEEHKPTNGWALRS